LREGIIHRELGFGFRIGFVGKDPPTTTRTAVFKFRLLTERFYLVPTFTNNWLHLTENRRSAVSPSDNIG
jgi:hypothetical protein